MRDSFYYLIFLFFPMTLIAQESDSIEIIQKLETFRFSEASQLDSFQSLLNQHVLSLPTDVKIKFQEKGIAAADSLEEEEKYIRYSINSTKTIALEAYDFLKARSLLLSLEDRVKALNSKLMLGEYHNMMAVTYQMEGNLALALQNYLKSYENYKNSEKPGHAIYSLFNISTIYFTVNDPITSRKYAEMLPDFNQYLSETNQVKNSLDSDFKIAAVYQYQDMLDSALIFANRAINSAIKLDTVNKWTIKRACCDAYLLGVRLQLDNNNQAAADTLLKKAARCKGIYEPSYSFSSAEYFLKTGEVDKAKEILSELPDFEGVLVSSVYKIELEADYLEKIGDYKGALAKRKIAYEKRKEMTTGERVQFAAFADVRFETVKKEAEIASLKKTEKLEKQKSFLFQIIAGLLGVLLLSAFFAYKKLKQNNDLLKNDLENQEKIRKQKSELEDIYAQRSKLFSNIAHELRTPLSLISGPIEHLLTSPELNKENKGLLKTVRQNSLHLIDISKQIMDLTKSEMVALSPHIGIFDWNELLNGELEKYEIQAQEQDITLAKKIEHERVQLHSDSNKLQVIINNLLQNALKFTKPGGTVSVQSSEIEKDIVFRVKDTGIGIDETDLDKVFERYYQSKENPEATGGFGIGLSVCREYAKALGGEISLDSKKGEGTTVTVRFPKSMDNVLTSRDYSLESINAPQLVKTAAAREPGSVKILLIEDNQGLREFLNTVLNKEYDVFFAKNGEEGLQKLESVQPDLIISDWMMPVMNGLEFVEKIRKSGKWYNIPVLMLTARSFSLDQIKALQKGVNDYLLKPFEVEELKVRIENLLSFSTLRSEVNTGETVESDTSNIDWVLEVEEVIYANLDDLDLNVEILSRKTGVSKSHFTRKIRRETGMTPAQFINEIRFWQARRLLEEGSVRSVKAVSYSVGFKSVKNFSRNFKKRFGKYPKSFLN